MSVTTTHLSKASAVTTTHLSSSSDVTTTHLTKNSMNFAYLLKEDGDFLLLETGDQIILEGVAGGVTHLTKS